MSSAARHDSLTGPRCPTCRRPVAWAGNPMRPFCSVNCKLVDLGRWLDERFALPGAPGTAGGARGSFPGAEDD